ncbi:type I polyketide synthase [Roseibium aestuarii]|uniref:SDR family NAD(P)-dependent oxidoreductase n=1 Tax=Roseibium aestuarii TaxID=2600299 RepID=A0ABW4JWF8_9HYPH|nr:type I polyketide synthase [Roseibium aestuarii]
MASLSSDIRILGYASRLPGAPSTDDFWTLLKSGTCAVRTADPDRWPQARFHHPDKAMAGRTYTWAAGQIDDVWGFDPAFFGISPREALQMDPQQRLLLQLVWEALEQANIRPSDLAGSQTGVYVGASSLDYHHRFVMDPATSDMQFMTGNTLSIVSNRLSYIYDLRGPSFTVDTACSSSLVALNEAVSALESGRIDTAIVAGVSLLLSPFPFIGFARATMLSPTGLCQAFDAKGDGYVRSEGAVVLVLQSERAARLPGTTVHARIKACGLNADGRTVGMSLPSAEAQGALLSEIYGGDLGLDPNDLAFVEAHGTGTRVGDPAEAHALGTQVSQKRNDPLLIGSVKTNVGHLEPASGLVGMLKSVLALKNDLLPASLHFTDPNPDIAFDELNLKVAAEAQPLERKAKPRLAGINSFGFGGTNAHAVICDGDAPEPRSTSTPAPQPDAVLPPLVLSAKSKDALAELAATYRSRLTAAPEEAGDLLRSAAFHRDLLSERLVVVGGMLEETLDALDAQARGETSPRAISGSAARSRVSVGFIYSGNGAQWAGMGQEAYRLDAGFQRSFEKVDRIFMGIGGWSLLTTLFSEDLEAEIERTEIAQPLLFAIQVAITEGLRERGIEPEAVAGHSVGEVAAAWASGALSLEQAVKVIHARSTEQEVVRDLGSMAALLLSEEAAREALKASGLPRLELAAVNSPRSVTISGDADSLDAFARFARKNKWALRRLNLAYPFHSALVDPIREPLMAALAEVTPAEPVRRFFSSVTPDEETPRLDADYWWRNVRQPVLFAEAVRRMGDSGIGVCVEIGPKPVLGTYVNDVLRSHDLRAAVLGSLDQPARKTSETAAPEAAPSTGSPLDRVAAAILASGGTTDLDRLVGARPTRTADLPLYPWQNTPFIVEPSEEQVSLIQGQDLPLLGYRLRPDTPEWFNTLDTGSHPWLADHKVEETTVLPAAGFAEMALRAALDWSGADAIELRDFDILRPLVLEDGESFETMVRISPDDRVVEIFSRPRLKDGDFALHARGHYVSVARSNRDPKLKDEADAAGGTTLDSAALYEITRRFGLNYGPAFQRATSVTATSQRAATLALAAPNETLGRLDFVLCPSLLDSGFHGLFALLDQVPDLPRKTSFLPIRIGALRLLATGRVPAQVRIRVTRASPRSLEAEFELLDEAGQVVARLERTRFRAVTLGKAERADDLVYRTTPLLLADANRDGVLSLPGGTLTAFGAAEGFATGTPPELSDATLLTEALGRSVAHESLLTLVGTRAFSVEALVAEGTLHESARALTLSLLGWLEESGQATCDESGIASEALWTLSDPDEGPDPASLLTALYREAGDRIATASLLARLQEDLPRLLREGLPPSAGAYFAPSLLNAHLHAAGPVLAAEKGLQRAALALLAAAPQDRPLRILLVGAQARGLAQALDKALSPATQSVVVTDPNEGDLQRAERLWTGSSRTRHSSLADLPEGAERFDLVLAAVRPEAFDPTHLTSLRKLSVPGALWLAVEVLPSPLDALIEGIGADHWAGDAASDGETATAPTSGEGWAQVLERLGLHEVETLPLDTGDGEIDISAGRLAIASHAAETGDQSHDLAEDQAQDQAEPQSQDAPGDDIPLTILCEPLGSGRVLGDALKTALAAKGLMPRLVALAPTTEPAPEDMSSSVADASDAGEPAPLRFIDLDAPAATAVPLALADLGKAPMVFLSGGTAADADPLIETTDRLWALTRLLHGLGHDPAHLILVAPGAQRGLIGEDTSAPEQAALWGYARVAANEFPDLALTLIDADVAADVVLEAGDAAAVDRLAAEILRHLPVLPTLPGSASVAPALCEEREIILDGDRRFGLRIEQGGVLEDTPLPEGSAAALRLDVRQQGSLDQLAWTRVARAELSDTDVEIEVLASGLNFRDVMWALGLLPEEALEDGFAGPTLGMECSGRVVRTGSRVTRFSPGDKVITFAPACFASHVCVDESGCAPMPSTVTAEQAATIPVTFLTAYYALVRLAALDEGETVLIHGGAGGVGLAALQIARNRGARIIATAGSPEKRAFLRLLGADVVLDSRSLAFVDEVLEETGGEGVDVVLNSLFGEAMERSIEVLKPFGRFLELGKRDYYGNTRIGLRPFRQNLTYFGIDADQLLTRQPRLAKQLFQELVDLFEAGVLTPLPYRLFEADQAVEAFRLMQQAGHVGKIVLQPPVLPAVLPDVTSPDAADPTARAQAALTLDPEATYLVAGGFGGFGVELQKRLARLGARHLAVLSRSGAEGDAARAVISDLGAAGVTVRGFACDLGREDDVASALTQIRAEMPPLRGVFHTAMVLDDRLIANLTRDSLERVLAPKMSGARALDRLTRQDRLDHFVLYSSATTLVGNPGQANYVAANAYLEALARARRVEGLPGLAVAWGAISDAGYLARNTDVGDLLARKLGKHALGAEEALDGLVALLSLPGQDPSLAALGYARIDWAAAARDLALLKTPLFGLMGLSNADDGQGVEGAIDLAEMLKGMGKVEATQTVSRLLAAEIAKILRISGEEIDPHKPLSDIGMDSLMALELRMSAERQMGIDIPLMSLANGATLNDLSGRIAARVLGDTPEAPGLSGDTEHLATAHMDTAGEDLEAYSDVARHVADKTQKMGSFL